MFPPESILTILGSLFIGLCCGITNRYLLNLVLSTILALIVESYAASHTLFYSFGDHLFKHLMIALILSSFVFGVLRFLANIKTSEKISGDTHGAHQVEQKLIQLIVGMAF
ncbi:hypothetical protein NL64_27065 [Pseudomonas fluorescens]|uniref:hypothetical protein n=1 Tax=Pseudomonas fluorescens TaxID=294 RepID=UPI00054BA79C|nr:hypothetical protein [Pseudomonas fluorescens]KII27600.1 hypothetical protein NL64_27065 [Pseudomonas fluorescens]